jgi:urease accessory protein
MRNRSKLWLYAIAALSSSLLFPLRASAHVNAGDTSGFLHGLQHPIGGLDHQLLKVGGATVLLGSIYVALS